MPIPVSQFLAEYKLRHPNGRPIATCAYCGKPIYGHPEDDDVVRSVKIDGKELSVHTDCYFHKMGGFVAKHPIGGGAPRG